MFVQTWLQVVLNKFNMSFVQWEILQAAYAKSTIVMYATALFKAISNPTCVIPAFTTADIQTTFWQLAGWPLSVINTLRQALIVFQAAAHMAAPPFESGPVTILFRALKSQAPKPAKAKRLPLKNEMIFDMFNFWARWNSLAAQRNAAFFALSVGTIHRFSP